MTRLFWAARYSMEHVIFTIGRQYGAGGRAVAAELGKKLGIPVYNNDILKEAAEEFGFSPEIFKKRDEKRHLFGLSRLFSSNSYNADNFMGDNMLFSMQSKAIETIADKGPCIIVGRCADYILRDREKLVSVFLTAPEAVKVERTMRRLDVDEKTACKIIARKERDRREFYNGYTLGEWGEAGTYKLCINTGSLSIESTADLIIDFARKAGYME